MLTTLPDIVSLYPAEEPVKGFMDGIGQMPVLSSLCLEEGGIAVLGMTILLSNETVVGYVFKFVCKGQRKYMDLANP